MKKIVLAFIFALLFSAVAGAQLVNEGRANPVIFKPLYAEISIQQPQEETYNTSFLALNFTAKTNYDPSLVTYSYIFDKTMNGAINNINITQTTTIYDDQPTWVWTNRDRSINSCYYFQYVESILEGSIALSELAVGYHNVTVYQGNIDDFLVSNTVTFVINATHENNIQLNTSEPFHATTATVSIVAVAMVSVGLFVYFKKFHRNNSP